MKDDKIYIVIRWCGMDSNIDQAFKSEDSAKKYIEKVYIDGGLIEYSVEKINLVD